MRRTGFIVTGLFILLPLGSMIYLSLVASWTFPSLVDAAFTSGHWANALSGERSGGLLNSIGLSLFISLTLATLATSTGFYLSRKLLFDRSQPSTIKWAFYPYLIAPVVLGSMIQFYMLKAGLTGTTLGVMLAQFLFLLPFSILLFSTFWNDRIRQMAFQASTLGASTKQLYLTVLLPLARPWLILSFVQCFLISWFEYGMTRMIGLGKVPTLTIRAMQFVREANIHQGALVACFLVIPCIILLAVNYKLFIRKSSSP